MFHFHFDMNQPISPIPPSRVLGINNINFINTVALVRATHTPIGRHFRRLKDYLYDPTYTTFMSRLTLILTATVFIKRHLR